MLHFSDLLGPGVTILIALGVIVFNEPSGLLYFSLGFFFTSGFQLLYKLALDLPRVQHKTLTQPAAERRFASFVFAGTMAVVGAVALRSLGAPDAAVILLAGSGIGAFLGSIPTLEKWKISAHASGSAQAATVLLLYGFINFEVAALIIAIIYANRLFLDAHEWDQLLAGTALGVFSILAAPLLMALVV
jgi:hypothetical protein